MKSKTLLRLVPGLCATVFTAWVVAATPSDKAVGKIAKSVPGISDEDVRPTPIPGIYEVQKGQAFGYVTEDGRYMIQGDLLDLKTGRELTEERRKGGRIELLQQFGAGDYIEYAPPPPVPVKHVITVYTDIDCGYCRKLHRQMNEYNANGIAVRYLFFPRAGLGSESHRKAEAVVCAADRAQALTDAKFGQNVAKQSCKNSIPTQYQVAQELGLRGTPMLILPDGDVVNGYLPPDALAMRLGEVPMADPIARAD